MKSNWNNKWKVIVNNKWNDYKWKVIENKWKVIKNK